MRKGYLRRKRRSRRRRNEDRSFHVQMFPTVVTRQRPFAIIRDLLSVMLEVNSDSSVVYTNHDRQLLYMRYTTRLPTMQFT